MQQLISFYFAGIDTTGHLVAFALYAIAEYPQYRQRIIDDIKANIQDLNAITYENLSVIILSFRNFNLLPTFWMSAWECGPPQQAFLQEWPEKTLKSVPTKSQVVCSSEPILLASCTTPNTTKIPKFLILTAGLSKEPTPLKLTVLFLSQQVLRVALASI